MMTDKTRIQMILAALERIAVQRVETLALLDKTLQDEDHAQDIQEDARTQRALLRDKLNELAAAEARYRSSLQSLQEVIEVSEELDEDDETPPEQEPLFEDEDEDETPPEQDPEDDGEIDPPEDDDLEDGIEQEPLFEDEDDDE